MIMKIVLSGSSLCYVLLRVDCTSYDSPLGIHGRNMYEYTYVVQCVVGCVPWEIYNLGMYRRSSICGICRHITATRSWSVFSRQIPRDCNIISFCVDTVRNIYATLRHKL